MRSGQESCRTCTDAVLSFAASLTERPPGRSPGSPLSTSTITRTRPSEETDLTMRNIIGASALAATLVFAPFTTALASPFAPAPTAPRQQQDDTPPEAEQK